MKSDVEKLNEIFDNSQLAVESEIEEMIQFLQDNRLTLSNAHWSVNNQIADLRQALESIRKV